jgi:hypothetical protein
MIPSEKMREYGIELECNIEAMPSNIAHLIYDLQTISIYKPSKRRAIIARAIAALYQGAA